MNTGPMVQFINECSIAKELTEHQVELLLPVAREQDETRRALLDALEMASTGVAMGTAYIVSDYAMRRVREAIHSAKRVKA